MRNGRTHRKGYDHTTGRPASSSTVPRCCVISRPRRNQQCEEKSRRWRRYSSALRWLTFASWRMADRWFGDCPPRVRGFHGWLGAQPHHEPLAWLNVTPNVGSSVTTRCSMPSGQATSCPAPVSAHQACRIEQKSDSGRGRKEKREKVDGSHDVRVHFGAAQERQEEAERPHGAAEPQERSSS